MEYNFEWDPEKARINILKHRVSFEQAASVFQDPRALSIYDKVHSEAEDRWITMGITSNHQIIIVNHTIKHMDDNSCLIRIFSSRKATDKEESQYLE